MEALTGIALPRPIGTCTRCAFEISTKNADGNFVCKVGIRYELSANDWRSHEIGSTFDPQEASTLLQDAQKLLLNPTKIKENENSRSPGDFLSPYPGKAAITTLKSTRAAFLREL